MVTRSSYEQLNRLCAKRAAYLYFVSYFLLLSVASQFLLFLLQENQNFRVSGERHPSTIYRNTRGLHLDVKHVGARSYTFYTTYLALLTDGRNSLKSMIKTCIDFTTSQRHTAGVNMSTEAFESWLTYFHSLLCVFVSLSNTFFRGGETIQAIQRNSGANVQVQREHAPAHPETREVTITGTPQQIQAAKDEIQKHCVGTVRFLL